MKILQRFGKTSLNVDNLYMDSNSVIYDAIRELQKSGDIRHSIADNYKPISALVCKKIQEYIDNVRPSNTVYIAFDGVAPLAKMNQQKTRRYKSVFMEKHGIVSKAAFNSCLITPGTDFMEFLSEYTAAHFKKNVKITKHTHNIISIDAPQGYLKLITRAKTPELNMRVSQSSENRTLNEQKLNGVQKYIVGKYDVEIFTLPRTYRTVEITQSKTTLVEVAAPGILQYSASKPVTGQIFVEQNNDLEWVCNLDEKTTFGQWTLQPGKYVLVYREKEKKSTDYTTKKGFSISSNKTIQLTL